MSGLSSKAIKRIAPNALTSTGEISKAGRRADEGRANSPQSRLRENERPPEFSDDALAMEFAERHSDDRRYVSAWSCWLIWDGSRWAPDSTLKTYDDVRLICRAAALRCNETKLRKAIASAATVSAVERLARSDRRIAAAAEQFDADPWQLNTPAGLVDLRTGELRSHDRGAYCTKITHASPSGSCPLWLKFLWDVTGGDELFVSYLARCVGYALTGSTREHAFFFLFGLGANGKTVGIETCARMLGDYAMPAPIEMFTTSKFTGHTTDVAGLKGARFVTASETEAGRTFAEARIKLLTGGEMISARKMRADNVAFRPEFKLFVTGNHKPHLTTNNEAIRRRLHLIPFNFTVPLSQRDTKLVEKLEGEWSGILAWAINGCLEWQREGLKPPAIVREATDEYLRSEDLVQSFIDSHVVLDPNARTSTDELFPLWHRFSQERGEPVGGVKEFVKALEAKGFNRRHGRDGNRWLGIRRIEK